MLLQNLHQEAQLLIDLFQLSITDTSSDPEITKRRQMVISAFWRMLFKSLSDAESSAAVAEAVTAPILGQLGKVI